MNWPELALLAAFFWAVSNIVDKYVVIKLKKNVPVLMAFTVIISAAVALLVAIFFQIKIPDTYLLALNLLLAFAWLAAVWFFYQALANEEVSRVIPIVYTVPLFVAVLAFVFLGEKFTAGKYLGIIAVVCGAILVGTEKLTKIKFSMGFYFALLSAMFFAVNDVIMKFILGSMDAWNVFFWHRMIALIVFLPIIVLKGKIFYEKARGYTKYIVACNFLSSFGYVIVTVAFALGPVTLVNVLATAQPLFVLLLSIVVGLYSKEILNEKIDYKTVALKFFGTILIIGGSLFVLGAV